MVAGGAGRMTLFRRIYPVFVAITILNFVVFVGFTLHLGGDAVNGKSEGGRYYLFGHHLHKGKKGDAEDSSAVYRDGKRHVYSIFLTWPLMIARDLVVQLGGRCKASGERLRRRCRSGRRGGSRARREGSDSGTEPVLG